MNIKITHSWLLEYLDTKATPFEIQKYLSLCGPSVERVEKMNDGDYSYDIEVTSNRVDTASVIGIAREAATILTNFGIKSSFKPPVLTEPPHISNSLPLDIIDDKKLCKRILAVVIDGVSIKPSPKVFTERLENAGIRSLNNLVDITNYVMLEMGHPAHVFDYDRIKTKKFVIRRAKNNEEIITLDDKKYLLNENDIIIDDGTGKVIDLPGIMGTANSVVTEDTKRVILFIESNDPVAIRKSSMRYGIRTIAATINEKNPDIALTKDSLLRGIALMAQHAQGKVASNIIDIGELKTNKPQINTTFSFINKRIGVEIPNKQILQILTNLDFKVNHDNDQLTIEVPSFRSADVTIEEDIVEEVARIYGYNILPDVLPPARNVTQPPEFEQLFVYQNKIKMFLKHVGLNEVLNYSMISKEMIEMFGLEFSNHLYLSNVLSEEIKYLRTTLLPSLIKNIKNNEGRREVIRFFELAKIYLPIKDSLPREEYKLGIATTTDFFDLKGIIEALGEELHIKNMSFEKSNEPMFKLGLQTAIYVNEIKVGHLGQLKSHIKDAFELKNNMYLTEIDFATLVAQARSLSTYTPMHPFAIVKLDHTMTFSLNNTYADFKQKAFKVAKNLIKLEVVDTYKDKTTVRFYFSSPSQNITEELAKSQLSQIVGS